MLGRYYEVEVLTPGYSKIGWARISCEAGKELGQDGLSYAFDGYVVGTAFTLVVHNNFKTFYRPSLFLQYCTNATVLMN